MKIGIIGAGIIGVTSALTLAKRGHDVTIFERSDVASGASGGNAGAFAFADVIPLATPGIMRNAPKWLLDPNGPLAIPPAYALKIAPWLFSFWRASLPGGYADAVAAQGALMRLSSSTLEHIIAEHGLQDLVRREGQLQVYEGERAFNATLKSWEKRREEGVEFQLFANPEAIANIQPGLSPRFTHAAFTPNWMNVVDPAKWTRRLADEAQASGVKVVHTEIKHIALNDGRPILSAQEDDWTVDTVVLSAGAHAKALFGALGYRLPLETERGYNVTFAKTDFDLRTHVTFPDHGFVVTKIGEGLRVGGGVELGGLKLKPNMSRAEALLEKAERFMPGIGKGAYERWMGFRPSMPDSLPVIDKPAPGLVFAFGHGHLGLTQSTGTALLVAELVEDKPTRIDVSPYSAARF